MTAAQYQALEDIVRYGNPWARVHGQAQHGGWFGVMRVLDREEWARFQNERWLVTDGGFAAMKQYDEKRKTR